MIMEYVSLANFILTLHFCKGILEMTDTMQKTREVILTKEIYAFPEINEDSCLFDSEYESDMRESTQDWLNTLAGRTKNYLTDTLYVEAI